MKALELLYRYDANLEKEKETAIEKENLKQLIIGKQDEISKLIYDRINKFVGVSPDVKVITIFILKKPHISITSCFINLHYHDDDMIIENISNGISYSLITEIKKVIDDELILEEIYNS